MNRQQQQVASFIERHGLHAPPAYRLLDLVSEVGELATDANRSTEYGNARGALTLSEDEVGDVLFALLALADSQGIDADEAVQTAVKKYEHRLADADTPSSE